MVKKLLRSISLIAISVLLASSQSLWACACGCGIFDVRTSGMLPTMDRGRTYLEFDSTDQNRNWHNSSSASADDNEDKDLRTHFYTAGAQYMFSQNWGVLLEVPFVQRHFETLNENGNRVTFNHSGLGDIRLRGIYTGFSPNRANGLMFGVKLPSGDYNNENFDRDTQIGSGSTDLLLGGFQRGGIGSLKAFDWFASLQADLPVMITPAFRPGDEVNAVIGAYYDGWRMGVVRISPLAQLLGSVRWSDTGGQSAHEDSGYRRVLVSPGLELSYGKWSVDADVAFPIYDDVNGNQLVASQFYKVNVSHAF